MGTELLTTTSTATEELLPIGERIFLGLKVTLLGMLVVFAVLTVIWGALTIMKLVFYKKASKKSKVVEETTVVNTPVENTAEEIASEDDTEAIVAAITVAIAEFTNKPMTSFRVVSFKRNN